jgi:phage terminase small subunit
LKNLIKSEAHGGARQGSGRRKGQVSRKTQATRAAEAQVLADAALTAARVLEEVRRVAFLDPIGFWREDGTLRALAEVPPEVRSALASYEVVIKNVTAGDGQQDVVCKIRCWDKVKALELLGKHFGLFTERIELQDATAAARVARLLLARKRVGDVPKEGA